MDIHYQACPGIWRGWRLTQAEQVTPPGDRHKIAGLKR